MRRHLKIDQNMTLNFPIGQIEVTYYNFWKSPQQTFSDETNLKSSSE